MWACMVVCGGMWGAKKGGGPAEGDGPESPTGHRHGPGTREL